MRFKCKGAVNDKGEHVPCDACVEPTTVVVPTITYTKLELPTPTEYNLVCHRGHRHDYFFGDEQCPVQQRKN